MSVLIVLGMLLMTCSAFAAVNDTYIKGYAAAALKYKFNVVLSSLDVNDGVLSIKAEDINGLDSGTILNELSGIEGVRKIVLLDSEPEEALPDDVANIKDAQEPVYEEGMAAESSEYANVRKKLFDPLIADPRWPHFSMSYQYYSNNDVMEKVAAASVGDVFYVYTGDVPFSLGGQWQVGFQASAFVIHDLGTSSWDQINNDYTFGLAAAYRKEEISALLQVYHYSSHIGDEFLLNNDVEREVYDYEAVGLLLSNDVNEWLRVYGGSVFRFSRSPRDLDPWSIQYGLEIESPVRWGLLTPVAGIDLNHRGENEWNGELSIKTGFQIGDPLLNGHKVLLLVDYFNGNSLNGQFYKTSDEYVSIGAHFYY